MTFLGWVGRNWLKLVLWACAAWAIGILGLLGMAFMWSWGMQEGESFDALHARRLVEQKPGLLWEVRSVALGARGEKQAERLAELASELGALEIRNEDAYGGVQVLIVFHRFGSPAETYEEQLRWVPPEIAAMVRGGGLRLGEGFQHISDGWWWVWW